MNEKIGAAAPREIVLDLDGPILDVARRHYRLYSDLAVELGFAAFPFETYWERKREPLGARRILELTGAAGAYGDFSRRWLEEIERDERLSYDAVWPGVPAILERWRERGYLLVLATMRQDAEALMRQLSALDLDWRFDTIVVCDRLRGGAGKADAVAARVGPAAAASHWIGDTEIDVEAARRRGSTAWAVSCGLRGATFLALQHPDRIVEGIHEIEPSIV